MNPTNDDVTGHRDTLTAMTSDQRVGRRGNRPLEVRMPKSELHLNQAIASAMNTTVSAQVREFLAYMRGETNELPTRPDIARDDLEQVS